jgi:hypothetical protein
MDEEYKIDILLNMSHAKIWKIDEFISEGGVAYTSFTHSLTHSLTHFLFV